MRRRLLLSIVLGLGVLVVPGLALADGEPDGTSTKAPEKASDGLVKNAAKRRAVRRDRREDVRDRRENVRDCREDRRDCREDRRDRREDRREAQRKAGRSEAPPCDVPSPANRAGQALDNRLRRR